MNRARFLKVLFQMVLILVGGGVRIGHAAARDTSWTAFHAGDNVEVDAVCGGMWQRVTILKIEPIAGEPNIEKVTVRKSDGDEWNFKGPGGYSPCMRPVSAAAAIAPVAGGQAQPLQGLYLRLEPTGTANAYVHYYFWKDGRLCVGLPKGGIDREPADFSEIQKQDKCGQYRVSGNRMSVKWQGDTAAHDEMLANLRVASFEMNGYATAKVGSFGSGQSLDGTFSATVVGTQMTKQQYVFHSDGTYQFTLQPVTSRDGPARNETGRYTLSANTLRLNGASGAKQMTAYPFPSSGLMIEGSVFSQ
jgi:hypothetical protein